MLEAYLQGNWNRLTEWRGTPEVIRVDNGQEFTSAIFEVGTRKHKIKLCFIQPRKPTQNTLVERFKRGLTVPSLNLDMPLKEKTIFTNASV